MTDALTVVDIGHFIMNVDDPRYLGIIHCPPWNTNANARKTNAEILSTTMSHLIAAGRVGLPG